MFSALSQGSLVHILDKTDGLKYKVGEIIGFTQPNQYGIYNPMNNTIDLRIKVDGNITDYPKVPCNASIFTYNNGSIVISETKEGLQQEVENVHRNFTQIISNIDYYKKSINDCEGILKELNPRFAKDKERDDRINELDSKIDKILKVLYKDETPDKLSKQPLKL